MLIVIIVAVFQYRRRRIVLSLPRVLAIRAADPGLLLSSSRETSSPPYGQGMDTKRLSITRGVERVPTLPESLDCLL